MFVISLKPLVLQGYLGRVGVHEVMPRNPMLGVLARTFCSSNSPTQNMCLQFIYFAAGLGSLTDFSQVNKVTKTTE